MCVTQEVNSRGQTKQLPRNEDREPLEHLLTRIVLDLSDSHPRMSICPYGLFFRHSPMAEMQVTGNLAFGE